jgi:hypothetical protein
VAVIALKLTLTPAVIAGATLAARRFGPSVGGWLIGLPMTAGPVLLFLAPEHGARFADHVAVGLVAGVATTFALQLGAGLSGVATVEPLLSTLLAVFAHRSDGPRAALSVYRGLLVGLFALMAFATTLAPVPDTGAARRCLRACDRVDARDPARVAAGSYVSVSLAEKRTVGTSASAGSRSRTTTSKRVTRSDASGTAMST